MNRLILIILLPLCAMLMYACTEFEDVGSGLVDGDGLEIVTERDIDYSVETYRQDSLIAYIREGKESDFIPTSHILAQLEDPVFGAVAYDLIAQIQFTSLGLNFEGAELDSVVLLLSYDTTFTPYGNYEQEQTLDVFELNTRDLPEWIFASDSFDIKPEKLGSHTFYPDYKNQNKVDSSSVPAHIRIPLSHEFGERILSLDTTVTASVIDMLDEFPGMVIRPRAGAFQGAFRFHPYAVGSSGQTNEKISDYSGIRIYYTQDGEEKEAYMRMHSQLHHFTTIRRHYEGSPVAEALQSENPEPEYVFLQPAGLGVKVRFPDLSQFQGKVINNVDLEWYIAEYPQDDTAVYRPLESIFALSEDGRYQIPVSDIRMYQTSGAYRQYFDGLLREEDSAGGRTLKYRFNITNQFQHMVNGSSDAVIYVTPTPQNVTKIGRSVIYGPGSEEAALRPKLSVTYSTINH